MGTDLFVERFAVQGFLSLHGAFGEQLPEEVVWLFALTAGRFVQAAQDAVIFQTFGGSGAVYDFAHDHHGSQAALGLIIGWRDAGATKAGKEVLLFRSQQALAKGLGLWMAHGLAAERAQLAE